MVTTHQITETFLKMSGASYSNGQVKELAIRLEKENGAYRTDMNIPCSAPRDKIDQLSCKSLENVYKKLPLSSSAKNQLTNHKMYQMNKVDEAFGSLEKIWERIEKTLGHRLSYVNEIYQQIKVKKEIKEGKKLFIPSKDISTGIKAYSNEWNEVEKFWNSNTPTSGNKDVFKQYWLWSHEFVKFEGISTSAKKTEICDIKYVMHYMGQGAYNREYAIKIVEMTKVIMKGKDYLLCEKDESMKTLIEPSTLYLFKSIDKSAQKKFIEMMLQVKTEMGSSFQKFHITSGKRGGVEHAYTVIQAKLRDGTLKNYYTLEPTKRYCNAIADIYNGNIPDWTLIDEKAKNRIQTIQKGDLDQATEIATELIDASYFQGTDHKNKDTLDFRSNNTSYKLELVARKYNFFTYSEKTRPDKGM